MRSAEDHFQITVGIICPVVWNYALKVVGLYDCPSERISADALYDDEVY